MDPRTRRELLAENEALYAEIEDVYERLGHLLEGDEEEPTDEGGDE